MSTCTSPTGWRALNWGRVDVAGKTPRKAALASWIGSVLEYYDFFIYGTAAALVFGKVFFPEPTPRRARCCPSPPTASATSRGRSAPSSWGTSATATAASGCSCSRSRSWGCPPSSSAACRRYDDIGLWAPALLVALRLMQGFSASGEQAGANALSLEHADDHRRAFFTSFTLGGTQAGLIIATAVFLPIGALPDEQLLSWGWRIPFWLSAVVVVVGLLIRRRLDETPAFRAETERDDVATRAAHGPHARPPHRRPARRARGRSRRPSARSSRSGRSRSRSTARARPHDDAVGLDRGERRRAGRDTGLGDARGPHRPQAGVHLRHARQRRAHVRLPGAIENGSYAADLRRGDR